MGEMDSSTSLGTRMSRTCSGSDASTSSERITVSKPGQYFTASSSSFTPSAAKSPAISRSRREANSFFTCWSRGFFREVIRSVTVSA